MTFSNWNTERPSVHRLAAAARAARGLGTLWLLAACTVQPLGASDANLARAKDHASSGAGLFEAQCADCHGSRGEGRGGVPAILGAGALRRHPLPDSTAQTGFTGGNGEQGATQTAGIRQERPELVTAENLQVYLSEHMPKIHRTPLSDRDYWQIVEFMLIAHGSTVPPEGVSRDNAARVAIQAP